MARGALGSVSGAGFVGVSVSVSVRRGQFVTAPELLSALRKAVSTILREELPAFLGSIEIVKAEALARCAEKPAAPLKPPPLAAAESPPEVVLTPEQVAERLGRSKWWVYDHRHELPVTRLPGRRWGVSNVKLKRWIERRSP